MPRAKRITLKGHYHLIVAKSSSDSQLFYDDSDFEAYIKLLKQMVRDNLVTIYAFCLQKDELRIAIKSKRLEISRIMQRLHCSHTMRINKRLSRRGHLFDGRFKSIIFTNEDLLNVVRSIHLWPVRIGLTRRAESYRYSSHSAYISGVLWKQIINTSDALDSLSNSIPLAEKAFARYVESAALEKDDFGVLEYAPGVSKASMDIINQNPKNKKENINQRRLSLPNIAKRVGLLLNVNPVLFITPSRRQDLVMARRLLATVAVMNAQKSITEVATYLNRDKAQISRLVSQGLDLININEPFKTLLESLKAREASLALIDQSTELTVN